MIGDQSIPQFPAKNGKAKTGLLVPQENGISNALNHRVLDRELRVLIYSQDGFGLGHLRRNLNITNQIKKICPRASVLIVADSPVAPFFQLPPQCDFIKIPTMVKVDYGRWESNRLTMNASQLIPVRAGMIQSAALSFRPDFMLVDHMPQGALGELSGPIKAIRRALPDIKLILGLRDILGDPTDIYTQWKREKAYKLAEKYYDKILVYGSEDMYPSTKEYQFSDTLNEKAQYCGYVSQGPPTVPFSNRRLQNLLPKKDVPLILVTGGGGYDAGQFMDVFLNTVRKLKKEINFKAVVSTGPFMSPAQIRNLRQKSNELPVWIATLGIDAIHFTQRADLMISMAGYNTTSEVMRFRKNAVIVPRRGPSAEQTIRSEIFERRNFASSIHPRDLTADRLTKTILARLESGETIQEDQLPDLQGAYNAALSILTTP